MQEIELMLYFNYVGSAKSRKLLLDLSYILIFVMPILIVCPIVDNRVIFQRFCLIFPRSE